VVPVETAPIFVSPDPVSIIPEQQSSVTVPFETVPFQTESFGATSNFVTSDTYVVTPGQSQILPQGLPPVEIIPSN